MGARNLELAILLLAPMIWIGRVHHHNWVNPVTAMVIPMVISLAGLVIWTPGVPFGNEALVVLVGSVGLFTGGAVCINVPKPPAKVTVGLVARPGRRWVSRYGALAIGAAAIICGRYAARIFDGSGGQIRAGVFDRATAFNNISGTSQGLIIRGVTAFLIIGGIGLLLFFASGDRRRWIALAMYWSGFYLFTVGTRGRESMFLTMLYFLVLGTFLLAPSGRAAKHSRRQGLVGSLALLISIVGLVFVYNQVAKARYGVSRGGVKDLVYSVASGPSAMSYALDNPGSVSALNTRASGRSIAGILDVLSHRTRSLGNQTSVPLSQDGDSRATVNIYTGIYILILDVGIPLTMVIMFALGVTASLLYRRLLTRPTAGLLCAYGAILLLLTSMPNTIVSQYNFWWLIFLIAPLASRFFVVEMSARSTADRGTPPDALALSGQPREAPAGL